METNRVQSDSDLEKGSIKNEQKSTTPDPVPTPPLYKILQGHFKKKTTTNKAKKLKMTLKDYLNDDNELEHENSIFGDILSKIWWEILHESTAAYKTLSFFFSIKKVLSTSYNPVFLSEGLQMKKKYNWKNKKKYQILTSMLYFCNCTAMSPKLSALGKVLLVPSKAPPCDTQPSTFSHVIISRSPLTRPSKPDFIPKGLFPSLMHVRTNDLTVRKK